MVARQKPSIKNVLSYPAEAISGNETSNMNTTNLSQNRDENFR